MLNEMAYNQSVGERTDCRERYIATAKGSHLRLWADDCR